MWEGDGDRTELQYIDPHSYGHQCCVFLVLQCCSTGGPGAQLFAEYWFSLPHLVSNSSDLQLTDFLSPLSYIIIQSPTQSLEWHVWSSSSGNNCHAVHRSLSSGASVYECTMGFLPCPIFSAKPAYAISSHNCHWNVSLPSSASLWNGMFGRVEGQYTTSEEASTHQIRSVINKNHFSADMISLYYFFSQPSYFGNSHFLTSESHFYG